MTEDEERGRRRAGAAEGRVLPGAQPAGDARRPDERRARELLWMAAHDLSAPLAAIRMHASVRERAGLCAEDARAALARVERLAASAQRLVDDVLAVERLEEQPRGAGAAEVVDAEQILGDVVAMQAAALERAGCSIFVTRRDELGRVLGRWRACSLERLFGNLIQNVIRHAPGAPIEVSFARRDDQLQIRFADGGPGLPPDARGVPRAFAETSAPESGHGLGLWIVYRLVAEMGGAIAMESRAGKGLSFDIRLPFGV